MTIVTDSPLTRRITGRPRVIVTRHLLPSIEARMAELFDVVANPEDRVMGRDDLIAAMQDCDVLVPCVADRIDAGIIAAAGDRLGPDEVNQYLRGLSDRLADDIQARWEWARQELAGNAWRNGAAALPEQPRSEHLSGTAALVLGSHVRGLTRSLGEGFERAVTKAMAKAEKPSWIGV